MTLRRKPQALAALVGLLVAVNVMSCDGDATPPDECDADAFEPEACGRALDARCREQASQEDCASQGPFRIRDFMYACNWARRVAFTDVASCAVNEPAYVCVAVSQSSLNGCDDGCSGNTDSYNTYQASNSSMR